MRPFVPGLFTGLVLSLLVPVVKADAPTPAPGSAAFPVGSPQGAQPPTDPAVYDGSRESLFSVNVLLGMQTGIRGQLALVRRDGWELVGEGFYGALLNKVSGVTDGAGLGGRAIWRRSSPDRASSMLIAPGLDLLCGFSRQGALLAAPSVDVAWLRGFGDGAGWESGINAGLGFGLAGERSNGKAAAGAVTPLISVYTGLRY